MPKIEQLITKFKTFLDQKQDSSQFINLLKSHFQAQQVYFYDYRYNKPFYYPDHFPLAHEFEYLLKHESIEQLSAFYAVQLSSKTYLILDVKPEPLDMTTRLLIESFWKYISYHQYAQFLQMILNYSPDMIAYKDTHQIYRYANKKAHDRWPNLDTLIHKHVSEVYPEQEVKRIIIMDLEAYQAKQPMTSTFEMMSEDGFLTVESLRVPVIENDQIQGILSINKNITNIKKIEQELKRSYDFQDILIQIASIFINVPIESANDAISKGLGMVGKHIQADRVYVFDYDFEKGITTNTHEYCSEGIKPMIDLLQDQPIEMIDAFWMERHLNHESVYIEDLDQLNHDSELYRVLKLQDIKSLLTIPLFDANRIYGFVGFDAVNDYAHWSEAEQQLLKVLAELIVNLKVRQAQQILLVDEKQKALQASKAKGEFLANMSHEIRTPLSGISNALYLLKNTDLNSEQMDYLDIAKSSVESLSRIVNNILDLSKIEAGKLELEMSSFDLENELFQLIKMQDYTAIEKGIQLVLDYDYSITDEIISDRIRFRQIMLNLISNAIKYTEVGKVSIKVRRIIQTQSTMTVRFEVIDTGIGIPRKDLLKITDQFYQIDASSTKKYQGTGLGLSIVKRLVELLNSTLEIESEIGAGSTFAFTLELPIGVRQPYETLSGLKNKRIAFVETDPIFTQNAIQFFSVLCRNIDIKTRQSISSHPYDFIFIDKPIDQIEANQVSTLRHLFGHPESKIILCIADAPNYSRNDLNELGIDYALGMPITRERVNYLLTTPTFIKVPKSALSDTIFKHKKILVVDDNKVNRQAMQIILAKAGLDVILATSGPEAIEKAQLLPIDLILMDIQMPGMDGYETAQIIRKMNTRLAKIPIIAVTANATESATEKAYAVGMNRSITKPFKPETLLDILKNMLEFESESSDRQPVLLDLNESAVMAAYDGDINLIQAIYQTFVEDYPEQVHKLQNALQENDFSEIEKVVHYLKGSTHYLFAEKSAKLCQTILDLVRQQKYTSISSVVLELLESLKTLNAILHCKLNS